jgi:LCCL domain-containing protein
MFFKGLMMCVVVIGTGLAAPALAQSGKKGSSGGAITSAPDCGELVFSNGEMVCNCSTGASNGSVWGSGPYTADSNICTAARHAGAIGAQGGIVRLLERPGQASYNGSSANGVSTSGWSSYGQSFDVVAANSGAPVQASGLPACSVIPSGVESYACNCAANAAGGSVWGNGPYTSDSNICSAALHAGYIEDACGDVFVLRAQGLPEYAGAESHGVTSSDWGAYGESIVFNWNY